MKLDDLTHKLRLREEARRKQEAKKPCDHAPVMNQLETMLKSKENEYKHARENLMKVLSAKEKELQTTSMAIKSCRAQSETIRKQKLNTEANVIGFDKINELVARLKDAQKINTDLTSEVQSL
eukprot:CAMPEP_0116884186 /NCGR_PEP_ID=MMETSP0463-20121206/16956_1 /TAXON_ID=181622 /ORGANISM="Strombidinopsis sp, Strain SopsisLIS2011" /LENGTH=122 /DNA_ID=CAMNT_0004540195 /DNA_START=273 /DNA_END=641 /DNA_ORIENTATION=-